MSGEYQATTDMTGLVHTPVDRPTSSRAAGSRVEHTVTGIPVTLIWLPYVGFSAILIALMALSFFQYHRKHGHKYHNSNDELYDTVNVDGIQDQSLSVSVEKTRDSQTRDRRTLPQVPASAQRDKRSHTTSHKAPPNGGVPTAHRHKYYDDHDTAASEHLIYKQPEPPEYAATAKHTSGYCSRPIPRSHGGEAHKPHGTRCDAIKFSCDELATSETTKPITIRTRGDISKPHCDEPSTSSSTVSSKNSSNASKANRNRPNRRHKAKINFESNQNGSMVDVRIPMEEIETFKPAKTREREKPNRPVSKPTATEQSMGLFRGHTDAASPSDDKQPKFTPAITDRIYRGNYVESRSTSPQSLQQASQSRRGCSFNAHNKPSALADDHISDYDRNDRAGSLPIWTTLNLPEKPPPPRRDYYSYPFTPSGHMQMLSDTEDDEVFLLKHTKL